MLTPDENKFVDFWERNRKSEKTLFQQFRFVIPIALIFGLAMLLNFFTGWYTRANMVANSQFSPMVLIIAVMVVAIFSSIFYKKHRWEMQDQRYQELIIKRNKDLKQQDGPINSPEETKI